LLKPHPMQVADLRNRKPFVTWFNLPMNEDILQCCITITI
jgi:hypothetical protein